MLAPFEDRAGRAGLPRLLILPLVLLLGSIPGYALDPERSIGQYARSFWGLDDGLPHGTIRSIIRPDGTYLWLATYDGLVRFDGRRFEIFDRATTPSIRNPTVRTVLQTRDGDLWIGTTAGLTRWAMGEHEIQVHDGPIDDLVLALHETSDGALWIGTEGGGLVRIQDDQIHRWTESDGLPSNIVTTVVEGSGNGLLIGTERGLARRTSEGIEPVSALSGRAIRALLVEPDQDLIGTDDGLFRVEDGEVSRVGPADDRITDLLRDRDGTLWIGTYNRGLLRLSRDRTEVFGVAVGLPDPSVRCLFEDQDGSIWVGTNGGLLRLADAVFLPRGVHEGLPSDYVRALLPDGDDLWIATASGLAHLGPDREVTDVFHTADGLPGDYVYSLARSRTDGLWIGTSAGLAHRSPEGLFETWTRPDGLPHGSIRAIVDGGSGPVWIGTDSGLAALDLESGTLGSVDGYTSKASVIGMASDDDGRLWVATSGGGLWALGSEGVQQIEGLPTLQLLALLVEPNGRVWVGTDGEGLALVDGPTSPPVVLTSAKGIVFDKITQIFDDGSDGLWLGSTRGLVRLVKNDVLHVAAGGRGTIAVQRFGRRDGLRTLQLNGLTQPSVTSDSEGRIWFATARGAVSAIPASIADRQPDPPPPTLVESIELDGVVQRPDRTILVAPSVDRIDIRWTTFAFDAPREVRSRYRVVPRDARWIEVGDARRLTIEPPAPGTYRVEVASSWSGLDWQTATGVDLVIQPTWWERPLLRLLLALALLGLVITIHRLRLRNLEARARELKDHVRQRTAQIRSEQAKTEEALRIARQHEIELEDERAQAEEARAQAEEANQAKTAFLAMTSHELRTPLTAILGYADLLRYNISDESSSSFVETILRAGRGLQHQIDNLLDLSKIQSRRMRLEVSQVRVDDVVHDVAEQARGLCTPTGIHLDTTAPFDLEITADAQKVRQILLNLLSNAIKFSPEKGTVTLEAEAAENPETAEVGVRFCVVDQGPGIPLEQQDLIFEPFRQAQTDQRPKGTGLGLSIVRHFVAMHEGTIHLESRPGQGARFEVWLPTAGPTASQPSQSTTRSRTPRAAANHTDP